MPRPADKLFDKGSIGGNIRDARKRRQDALDEITGTSRPRAGSSGKAAPSRKSGKK